MKRNKFSLSNTKLFSCDMGKLLPIGVQEVLPGDTIQQNTTMLLRCSPLLSPVMHPVDVRIHHWYVPLRLLWEDWESFITGGPDGLDASTPPYVAIGGGGLAAGSLGDYLGLPISVAGINASAMPYRAYDLIWNEWYRDQDLQTALTVSVAGGQDTTSNFNLQNVCWEKDYFTSARPWEQKGPSVTIPLGTEAPVLGIGMGSQVYGTSMPTVYETGGTASTTYTNARLSDAATSDVHTVIEEDPNNTGFPYIRADLTNASAADVNLIREAFALQRFEEMRARYGSRYTEYLRFLGVKSSDARLQRPEYLGGGRQTIQFSEVLQTAGTTDGSAVGVADMKGHGIAAVRSNRYRRFIEEHGYVLTLMSVRPKTIYMQGLPRHFSRNVKEDYWQKELEHIGQQEVYNKEIYAAHSSPEDVFGYQDRYDEYRRTESSVSGEFRTSTLNFWHLARDFSSDPALNSDFVTCVPTERVFASSTPHVLWCMAKHSVQARRLVAPTGRSFIF